MGFLLTVLLIAQGAAASPDSAQVATDIDFQIGTTALTIPTPAGYCLPTGTNAAVAQLLEAGDKANVTHLSLMRCGADTITSTDDYTLIKTPTAALLATISRPELLATIGAEFDKPEFKAASDKAIRGVSNDLSKLLSAELAVKGTLRPLGKDDVCAYLGGVLAVAGKVRGEAISYDQPIGACITSVAGKVITIYRYGKDVTPAGVGALMREAKALVLTIHSKSK